MKARDYLGVGEGQQPEFKRFPMGGFTIIRPLAFLHGRKWDDLALGFIHALRPSSVRVVKTGAWLNSSNWRVTVWLNADDTIRVIEQEVAVGLPEGIQNGHEMNLAVKDS